MIHTFKVEWSDSLTGWRVSRVIAASAMAAVEAVSHNFHRKASRGRFVFGSVKEVV
jgi:hypothetical protein